MLASEVLKAEHRGIERMLRWLAREAARIEAGEQVQVEAVDRAVDFLRNFADRCHHTKEEAELFPALQRAGVPAQGGPVGVMLADHDQGRAYIRAMAEALASYKRGDTEAAAALAASTKGYVNLLTSHIWKEDNILFEMADQLLPEEEQARLVQRFDAIESDHMGPGVHERYHRMLDELDVAA